MNIQELDILKALIYEPFNNQRRLSEITHHSLGVINKSLKNLKNEGFINENFNITSKTLNLMEERKPKSAIILAAGFGMRMVPINTEYPKAFLKINGECLIERIIKQLHEVGVFDISIVVGFMKEKFEYLIDEYNVKLIINNEYAKKNNLHSLKLVKDQINNSYIIPSDLYCRNNPFSKYEFYSWYLVSEEIHEDSFVKINRNHHLIRTHKNEQGQHMIGISYICKADYEPILNNINEFINDKEYDHKFWEETLFIHNKMIPLALVCNDDDFIEINTYEQLREIDRFSNQLKNEAMKIICDVFDVDVKEIKDIKVLKKGMTNRSFLFTCLNQKYIMRIPGEGTDYLINRKEEAEVYRTIIKYNISDEIIYINENNGYKITKYLEDARTCNPNNDDDLKTCMAYLRYFHNLNLKVNHFFDLFTKINYYESLWDDGISIYKDYEQTKKNIFSLRPFIDKNIKEYCLCHIDSVYDNFLFANNRVYLIDFEYAAMQDKDLDIAMFCIYALYDQKQVDHLIDIYYENKCPIKIRAKIYAYIACAGLLWSNWCEYKLKLGIEFGEYSIKQYRYAKSFYKKALNLIEKIGDIDE